MAKRSKNGDYEVGYGRPPKHSRFQPGESGHPEGRTKRSRNKLTILREELSQRVTVTENGQRKTIPKSEVVIRQLVNKAASGDPRAIALLLANWDLLDAKDGEAKPDRPVLTEVERAMLMSLAARMNLKKADGDENE